MDIGFVFKADDKLYVTEYTDGQFTDGHPIDNWEPYRELGENQLAFVEVKKYDMKNGDVAYTLKDYGFYTLDNNYRDNVKGYEVLLELDCRDELCKFIEELKDKVENKEKYEI